MIKVVRINFVLLVLLGLCVHPWPVVASGRPLPVSKMPVDLDQVDIFLETTDAGAELYAKFGHTAIRIRDKLAGTDQVYNFGFFDAADPLFAWNFFRGILRYQMADYSFAAAMRMYRSENRQVWQDAMHFTRAQKARVMERLIWQSRPENRSYDYYYFFDNCSTRPRDIFDYALGGEFQKYYAGKNSRDSFRDVVRSHMRSSSFIELSLDILMNSRLDGRPMTVWEEMFLPLRLRDALLAMPRVDDVGALSADAKLMTPDVILIESPSPQPDAFPAHVWATILGSLLVGWSAFRFIANGRRIAPATDSVFGLTMLLWAGWSGVFGLLMSVSWGFSDHLDLHHNANLLLFFPTDLLLLPLGIKWFFRSRASLSDQRLPFARALKLYATLHIVCAALAFGATFAGLVAQDIGPIRGLYMIGVVFWALVVAASRANEQGAGR